MIEFIGLVGGIVVLCAWIALLIYLGMRALDRTFDNTRAAIGWGLVAVLVLAVPVAAAVVVTGANDPNANRLCLRGYQQWHTTRRPPMLAGKVIVPGGTRTSKVWVCEQWEAR
jgi:hypothetical protein